MTFQAADLYNDIEDPPPSRWRDVVPGLVVALAATAAAAYLSDHYGAPLTLMALLIGLALNFLGGDVRLAAGLGFSSRTLLRIGIVLVGVRITLSQIVALGPEALGAIIVIVALVIGTAVLVARRLGLGAPFGVLAGGAVAICGASAAMAFASLLGERRLGNAQLALTLVGISAASALAMVLYPLLAHHVGLTDSQAGFLLGASIHDVAQSLGAGYAFSAAAGQTAAIVKLTRVALLAPALAVLALFFPAQADSGKRPPALPWFVIGFFALALINSTGVIPFAVAQGAERLAAGCLACAVAATGIRSPMAGVQRTCVQIGT
ncbi:MAG: putative sulfate exporter family transporter [Sphingomonadales bacterium]|nr:putative sulfate exporter family transporter [Sphingomonadales bacterium]